MLNINKHESDEALTIELSGSIIEQVNFPALVGPISGLKLIVNCRGVIRINSVGVKHWIVYFTDLRAKGISLEFIECPPPIVEQLNSISNFVNPGEVTSILLPYSCAKCDDTFTFNCPTEELIKTKGKLPNNKCDDPQCEITFDDIAEDYLYFLFDE